MKYSWLENLASEGHIRPEVKEEIYNSCSALIEKNAGSTLWHGDASKGLQGVKSILAERLPELASAAMGAVSGVVLEHKINSFMDMRKVTASRETIAKDPELASYKAKALARFDELASYSPQAAANPSLATKIVKQHLHSGFTPDEVMKLELHGASGQGVNIDPARYSKKVKSFSKKASVSHEVEGKTLATMTCILKEAMAANEFKSMAHKMHAVSGHALSTMAALTGASLLAGLGTGLVNTIKSKVDSHKLKQQLEASFLAAMRQSDPSREPLFANQAKARQAFDTLAHFSPKTATSPAAARAFMNTMVSHDLGTSTGTIKELSEIERNLKQVKSPNPFFTGFAAGAEATGLKSTFSNVNKELFQGSLGEASSHFDTLVHTPVKD